MVGGQLRTLDETQPVEHVGRVEHPAGQDRLEFAVVGEIIKRDIGFRPCRAREPVRVVRGTDLGVAREDPQVVEFALPRSHRRLAEFPQ